MSDLFRDPKDWFSRVAAHMTDQVFVTTSKQFGEIIFINSKDMSFEC